MSDELTEDEMVHLFRTAWGEEASCPQAETWLELDPPPTLDPTVVRAHIDTCTICSAHPEFLHTLLAPTPPEADLAFVRQGVDAHLESLLVAEQAPPAKVVWLRPRTWVPVALAAAALLAFGLNLPGTLPEVPTAPSEIGTFRGDRVVLEAPQEGSTTWPSQFAWKRSPGAGGYQLTVERPDGTVLWTVRTEAQQTTVSTPEALRAQLHPGSSYAWKVTALDDQGAPIGSSLPATFATPRP